MDLQTAIEHLSQLQKKQYAYGFASGMIYLDSVTTAPANTAEGRSVALGILSGEEYSFFTSKQTEETLYYLKEQTDALTKAQVRQVALLLKEFEQIRNIPKEQYTAYTMLISDA